MLTVSKVLLNTVGSALRAFIMPLFTVWLSNTWFIVREINTLQDIHIVVEPHLYSDITNLVTLLCD